MTAQAKIEEGTLAKLRERPTIWLPVVGYEGLYSVSSDGQIRSEQRTRLGKGGKPVRVAERILKPAPNRDGHLRVLLCDGKTKVAFFVHSLVLVAYVGPTPDGHQGCHNNGKPADNRLSNLRWGTARSNQHDRRIHGTSPQGKANGQAKLSESQVLAIRSDARRHAEIAADYGVSRSAVGSVKARKTWAHLGELR